MELPEILRIAAGVTGVPGLLGLGFALLFAPKDSGVIHDIAGQYRVSEQKLREILADFKDEAKRLEALKEILKSTEAQAKQVLDKLKQAESQAASVRRHRSSKLVLGSVVLIVVGLIALASSYVVPNNAAGATKSDDKPMTTAVDPGSKPAAAGSNTSHESEQASPTSVSTPVAKGKLRVMAAGHVEQTIRTIVKDDGWEDLTPPFEVSEIVLEYERFGQSAAKQGVNRKGHQEVRGDRLGVLGVIADPEGGDALRFDAAGQLESGRMLFVCRVQDAMKQSVDVRVTVLVESEKPLPIESEPLRSWCEADSQKVELDVAPMDLLENKMSLISVSEQTKGGGKCEIDAVRGQLVYTPKPGYEGEDIITYKVQDQWNQRAEAKVRVRVGPRNFLSVTPAKEIRTASGVRRVEFREQQVPGKPRTYTFFDDIWREEFQISVIQAPEGSEPSQPANNQLMFSLDESAQEVRIEFLIIHIGSEKEVYEGVLQIQAAD